MRRKDRENSSVQDWEGEKNCSPGWVFKEKARKWAKKTWNKLYRRKAKVKIQKELDDVRNN